MITSEHCDYIEFVLEDLMKKLWVEEKLKRVYVSEYIEQYLKQTKFKVGIEK